MLKVRVSLVLLCLLFCKSVFAYGALSEFISADGSHFRDVYNSEGILSTDIIKNPKWPSSSLPLSLTLCTNAGFTSTRVRYQSDKNAELLSDISAAQTTWSFGSGSLLSFSAPATDASCASSSSYNSAHRMVYFSALDPGILAITPTTIVAQGGELVITDGDIIFTNSASFDFLTHACDLSISPAGTCTSSATPYTFLGILTHEMGHLVGISHSMINDDNSTDGTNTTTTMYPSISSLSASRANESLTADDQLARQNLYPETNFPSNTGGTVSGKVMRSLSLGQRGAHVAVFDLTNNRTIAGAYTSMSGTRANPTGDFEIKGVPLNTDFALFVEPIDRTGDGLSTSYSNINTPIEAALYTELDGLFSFQIEAYPDVLIPDVRLTRDASISPGFGSAHIFRLTSSASSISGIVFYISESNAAPNDATDAALTFSSRSKVTTDNPLTLTLSNPFGLQVFSQPTVTLTATRGSQTLDWTRGLSAFDYETDESKITINPTDIEVSDGDYTVTATLVDDVRGTFSTAKQITVSDWHAQDLSGTSDGGGLFGCSLKHPKAQSHSGPLLLIAFLCVILMLRSYYRKSFTSRASILSRPKLS